MITIGITGGVGAGKSAILDYLKTNYDCEVLVADIIAHKLEEPGNDCYNELVCVLGKDVLDDKGYIVPSKMAKLIFSNQDLLKKVNSIIHPAVKKYILDRIDEARGNGRKYVIVEAALLIEEGYQYILDKMWYVHTDSDIRRERLKSSRGYSDEKIDSIMRSQMTEQEFRSVCDSVIYNNTDFEDVKKQIVNILGDING